MLLLIDHPHATIPRRVIHCIGIMPHTWYHSHAWHHSRHPTHTHSSHAWHSRHHPHHPRHHPASPLHPHHSHSRNHSSHAWYIAHLHPRHHSRLLSWKITYERWVRCGLLKRFRAERSIEKIMHQTVDESFGLTSINHRTLMKPYLGCLFSSWNLVLNLLYHDNLFLLWNRGKRSCFC